MGKIENGTGMTKIGLSYFQFVIMLIVMIALPIGSSMYMATVRAEQKVEIVRTALEQKLDGKVSHPEIERVLVDLRRLDERIESLDIKIDRKLADIRSDIKDILMQRIVGRNLPPMDEKKKE